MSGEEFKMVEGQRGPKAYALRVPDKRSERELGSELTELLVTGVPTLTGAQIIAVRTAALGLARSHGWID